MSYTAKNLVDTLSGGYPNSRIENLGSQKEETGGRQK